MDRKRLPSSKVQRSRLAQHVRKHAQCTGMGGRKMLEVFVKGSSFPLFIPGGPKVSHFIQQDRSWLLDEEHGKPLHGGKAAEMFIVEGAQERSADLLRCRENDRKDAIVLHHGDDGAAKRIAQDFFELAPVPLHSDQTK